MWSTAREIAAGDLVIVWLTRDAVQPLVITPGKELNGKYGVYRHSDLIGVPYGSKIGSRNGRGFIHVLRPTPELWTLALPHRTQILYIADIAFVSSWLNIKPGSRIIEAGTGSGSFTHSVARAIGPAGHLWSYEFHEARVNKAREEFSCHGMDDIVTLTHRNVCKDGFTVLDTVDAVFLDLPMPWEAVEHAKKALRKDRTTRICCFSPCMEQVLRTVTALNDAGFTDITMYETLLRPHQVDSVPALPHIGQVSEKLKKAEQKREEKRLRQIANSRASAAGKRKRPGDADESDGGRAEGSAGKRPKTDDEDDVLQHEDGQLPQAENHPSGRSAGAAETEEAKFPQSVTESATPTKTTFSKTFPEVRGHTSYLTFACLLPAIPSAQADPATQEPVPSD
ncbi:tRNA methyltransferase complex GCD14 subunit [Rhodofomes roseus]|uniref:tRNA (adenine(58)-N(1))-methyltransferase catalytic subunit TRM61 n=1 Tax=Rhodofomes roseus TaxID=34475 RepID=A0ABQ8KS44_9APHY|nr:tRNA methyltransferase complex GCD14 subunit [Rhodofomes roseus]KAH9841394.1 tRNA methyltransferase complex GCD14 subunit [Rhodofomes roseus]